MKNKKNLYIMIVILLSVSTFIVVNNKFKQEKSIGTLNGLPVYNDHAIYALDTSTPGKAYGASRYVFIAKVNSILKTEYINPVEIETGISKNKTVYDPVTVYSISVIENLKGELITSEAIELKQYGGISKDKKSYSFVEGGSLLNVNEYYMFLTGAEENGGILEATNPERIISLGTDLELIQNIKNGKINSENISSVVTKNLAKKIEKYIFAKKEEVLPTRFDDTSIIPVLDNISKYDVNY